ncbi:hypothetical protein CPTAKMECS_087 [Salmonella phage vB_SenS-AKM_ECS]|uniref:Uncharacterized protein n=1 Tax=Salmonella phage vB_SenS-AKM_HA2021_32 TaxID=3158841 RepID=A0AAU7L2U4_9CAUD|nr:hypothetical protein CPTAKMECS_087 [Salmonella phage vB_SenS-AKM_ECS]
MSDGRAAELNLRGADPTYRRVSLRAFIRVLKNT